MSGTDKRKGRCKHGERHDSEVRVLRATSGKPDLDAVRGVRIQAVVLAGTPERDASRAGRKLATLAQVAGAQANRLAQSSWVRESRSLDGAFHRARI